MVSMFVFTDPDDPQEMEADDTDQGDVVQPEEVESLAEENESDHEVSENAKRNKNCARKKWLRKS